MRNLETGGVPEALPYVSTTESLRGKLRRAKVKANAAVAIKVLTTWSQLRDTGIPDNFSRLENGSQFLRFFGRVSEGKEEMMAIFASDHAIEMLESSTAIFVDGTFSTCPPPFHQLFIVLARLPGGSTIPCVFGLLPNKLAATYTKFFTTVANFTEKMFTGNILKTN